ncbi:MAG: decarboxylase, partial [Flavobacteriaceae bacterium]|nr:decarboxylase [Flavobacteriaceae bacterium]
ISQANLAIINFRYNPIELKLDEEELDLINQGIVREITASRSAMLATTVLQDQVVLRMCLINPRTTMTDIRETLELCEEFANKIQKNKTRL